MKVIETILDFCHDGWGEDRLFVKEQFCGVIDGATPIRKVQCGKYHSHAEWMADQLKKYIENECSTMNYPLCCKKFVEKNHSNVFLEGLADYDLPCLTTAAVCVKEDILGYVLGDCKIVVKLKSGKILSYTDSRVEFFAQKTIARKAYAIQHGEDVNEAVNRQKQRNRARMNTKGGYWTVGFKGNFEKEFVTFSIPKQEVSALLIYTDGFERLFQLSDITLKQIFNRETTLKEAQEELRMLERKKAQTTEKWQVKAHDDVAAILIETDSYDKLN